MPTTFERTRSRRWIGAWTLTLAAVMLPARSVVAADPPKPVVENKVPMRLQSFAFGEVTLGPGPLKDAFETNVRYLRSLTPDRYLWTFRKTAGLATPDRPYGGWEEPNGELRGHSIGHYLSACARIIAQTGDPELKKNADYTVAELARCQAKHGNGYLSAYPEEFFDRVERGERVWAPYYTMHKIMLGLWEMHACAGNAQALEVLAGMADYFKRRCDKLDDAQMQKMLNNEFGGMHEVLLNLYASTGEEKYLALARRFVKRSFITPLAEGKDCLPGLHANTHIPQVAGQARAYELTGDEQARKVVEFFWNTLVTTHSYATGGSNVNEAWGPPNKLAATMGATNQEFCTSYNFEKICRYLLHWSGDPRYADMIERLFYNGILVSQHPKTGMLIYYLPFKIGLHKEHGTPFDTFTCCYGTGIQEYASLAQDLYYHTDDSLYVNLFADSTVAWKSPFGIVRLIQQTEYPATDKTRLQLAQAKPAEFKLVLRIPWWAAKGFGMKVNGTAWPEAERARPGTWLTIARTWKDGDTVELTMPMSLTVQPINDDPTLSAVMYGPMVLAGLVDVDVSQPDAPAPIFTGDIKRPDEWIKPVSGKALTFRTTGQPQDVTFVPIHKVVEESYGLYWRFVPPGSKAVDEFSQAVAKARSRRERTIDSVIIGDPGSEQAHDLQGEHTQSGPFPAGTWRHAVDEGFFSYRLKVDPKGENILAVTYWGSDSGGRTFDILIDGKRLATQTLDNNEPERLFVVEYALPRDLTADKPAVVVRFQPSGKGQIAGGIFNLAVLRRESNQGVNLLNNPSFEDRAGDQPVGWRPDRWGGEAAFEYADIGHSGKHSMLISSEKGADAGWASTLAVDAYSTYRLSGWIKTEEVSLRGGRGALLNVHNIQPVATQALLGTNDWTRVEVEFQTGEQDAIQVNCLFGGWGQATGKAWYDDVSLEQIAKTPAPEPRIVIDAADTGAPISKYVYGQFIEHLGRCIYGGIWAEMLEDRKFFYAVGAPESPWKPLGAGDKVTMIDGGLFVGEQSPQVSPASEGNPGGIWQGDLGLVKDKAYVGRIWLAGRAEIGPVQVSLVWGDGPKDRQSISIENLTDVFAQTPLRFTAGASTDQGRLEITASGKGVFIVGCVSLMPADNVQGMRADTLALLKELNAPVYRWPGGNFVSGYNWEVATGDRDRRPPCKNPAWQGAEQNDFGIDEFLAFCRILGTEPYITVNSGAGDVRMAVEEVQYANGAVDTPMGKLRAANGHPEPYGVKFWSIGNEMYGDWQIGHMPLEQYVRKHNQFAEAMRRVDPTIALVAVGAVGPWSEAMLRQCAEHMDYVSEHFYCQEQPGLNGHVRQMPEAIRRIAEAHRQYRRQFEELKGKDIRIALDEWNYWYGPHVFGELGTRYFLKDGLGIAAGLHEYARNSDLFFMANYAQTVNVIGCIKTDRTSAAFETTGLVLKLYRERFGVIPVATKTTPLLDAMAAWSEDRRTLTLGIINPALEPRTIALEVRGAQLTGQGTRWEIAGSDPMAYNSPGQPARVKIAESPVDKVKDNITVAPCSVTIVALRTESAAKTTSAP